MTTQEMESLWAEHFTSPFPRSSAIFWAKYPTDIIEAGFEALSRKCQTHTFATLTDASRFATAVMRTIYQEALDAQLPAPEIRQAGV